MNHPEAYAYVNRRWRVRLVSAEDRKKLIDRTIAAKDWGDTDAAARAYALEPFRFNPLLMALLGVLLNFVITLALEWWRKRNET